MLKDPLQPRRTQSKKTSWYHVDKNSIIKDLSDDRPLYILSSYGPGKDAPQQLFGGQPREQSFEELRFRHYELAASGNERQAIQEAQALYNNAEQQNQNALKNVDGALKYVLDAEHQHPNRYDICKAKGGDPSQRQASAGFQPRNTQSTAAFGQQNVPQGPKATTFGRPSAPGPAFGQPSTFGQNTSAFGQPSGLGKAPAFGQPSNPSPFAAPTSSQSTAMRQPSNPFGPQPTQPNNAFGQTSNSAGNPFATAPTGPSAFNQTAAPPSNAFSTAQPSNNTAVPLAFGQTSAMQKPPNMFGQTAPPQGQGVFGQNTQAAAPPSAPKETPIPPLSGMAGPVPLGAQHPASTAQRDAQGKLIRWNGQAVTYVDGDPYIKASDGGRARIFFPDGPPVLNKTQELPDEMYSAATKEAYQYVMQHGTFKDGVVPELPPKRAWCTWDF
ncbi:MAG: hypothetical protein LQ342_005238 [Letrouitia transgressa]|nr:MAG: hypothetical protein LQ342_005238 [Letrouitia transgressa]